MVGDGVGGLVGVVDVGPLPGGVVDGLPPGWVLVEPPRPGHER